MRRTPKGAHRLCNALVPLSSATLSNTVRASAQCFSRDVRSFDQPLKTNLSYFTFLQPKDWAEDQETSVTIYRRDHRRDDHVRVPQTK